MRTVAPSSLLGYSQNTKTISIWGHPQPLEYVGLYLANIFTLLFPPLMHKTFIDHLGILANTYQVLTMYQVLFTFNLNSVFTTFYR